MKRLTTTLLILATAWTASAQELVESETASENRPEKIFAKLEAKAALWNELTAERVAGTVPGEIVVGLNEEDKQRLDCPECFHDESTQALLVGLHLPVDVAVRFGETRSIGLEKSETVEVGRTATKAEGGFVWTTSVRAEEANGLRIRFSNVDLPDGAALYIYSDAGEAHGPYSGRGPHDSGEFWSNSVLGQDAWVQLHVDGDRALAKMAFDITEVSYLGPAFQHEQLLHWNAPAKADCSGNVSCVENGECWSSLDSILNGARRAVARLVYASDEGGSYLCSGGLLNDNDSSDRIAWFLTADHCINSESEADSLEAKFQYQSSCGSCSGSAIDTVLGADHWASSDKGDFSLLALSELPANWTLQGWTNAKVLDDDGTQIYRISHPKGKPQAFSQHEIRDKRNDSGFPYNTEYYIYSKNVIGTIEGGSSGSPVFRSDKKVVGQLYGVVEIGATQIEANPEILCDPTQFHTRDGALSYYWKSVRPYLHSPTGTYRMHVADVAPDLISIPFGGFTLYHGLVKVQIVDELGNGIPRALVNVALSGQLAGGVLGVTDADGYATMLTPPVVLSGSLSYSACVTGVTHDHFNTYDSGSNVETCDSL